jgi:hypothetical protein
MRRYYLFVLLLLPFFGIAQDADETLKRLKQKLNQVKEYTAKVQIDTRLPFIKMLPVSALIHFKQPDVFEVKSKGIVIIPRQGLDQINRLLNQASAYTVVPQGNTILGGIPVQMMTLIPVQDTGEVLMGKLWVDPKGILVMKSQLTTRSNGTVVADFQYGTQAAYGLPDKITFQVDVKKFKIPKAMTGDMNTSSSPSASGTTDTKGTIQIRFSEYKITSSTKL